MRFRPVLALALATGVAAATAAAALHSPAAAVTTSGVDDKIWLDGLNVDAEIVGIIVKYRGGSPAAKGDLQAAEAVLPPTGDVTLTPVTAMANRRVMFSTEPAKPGRSQLLKVMRKIAANDEVAFVEPDLRVARPTAEVDDPGYPLQWHYHEARAGARVPDAWELGASGSGMVVAVIDTGITGHPDLDAQVIDGYDFISQPWTSRDGDGRDGDPHDAGDWTAAGECRAASPARNSSWHGTHVAGTIAAQTDNGLGVAGVAPGAWIQPVRVLGRCGGTTGDIADAIAWSAGALIRGIPRNETPAHVANLSLGGISPCAPVYQEALTFAYQIGMTVVIAAGNDNIPADLVAPANCAAPHITVAALGRQGNRAGYSNFGPSIDVAAPGGDMSTGTADGVLSTMNTGATVPAAATYSYSQGTSMATPHVAGIAALMLGVDDELAPERVEAIIKSTSRPIPGECPVGCGAGLVDAGGGVRAVGSESLP